MENLTAEQRESLAKFAVMLKDSNAYIIQRSDMNMIGLLIDFTLMAEDTDPQTPDLFRSALTAIRAYFASIAKNHEEMESNSDRDARLEKMLEYLKNTDITPTS